MKTQTLPAIRIPVHTMPESNIGSRFGSKPDDERDDDDEG